MNTMNLGHKETSGKVRIETRAGCTLVFGALPLSQLRDLTHDSAPGDVLSPELAHLSGATFAYGSVTAVEALIARARSERLAAPRPAKLAGLEQAAQDWAVAGEVGLSAATIFAWVTGIKLDVHEGRSHPADTMPTDYPHDPSDLRRCRLLLDAVPSIAERFSDVMPAVSPTWAALTEQWTSICATMDRECPNWRSPSQHAVCRDTFRLMQAVIEQRASTPAAGVSP